MAIAQRFVLTRAKNVEWRQIMPRCCTAYGFWPLSGRTWSSCHLLGETHLSGRNEFNFPVLRYVTGSGGKHLRACVYVYVCIVLLGKCVVLLFHYIFYVLQLSWFVRYIVYTKIKPDCLIGNVNRFFAVSCPRETMNDAIHKAGPATLKRTGLYRAVQGPQV